MFAVLSLYSSLFKTFFIWKTKEMCCNDDVSFTLISIVSRSAWKCANYQNDLDKNTSLCFVTRWCCNHRVSSTNQHLKSQFYTFFLWRRRFLFAGFITSTRNFHTYLVFYLIFAEKNYFCVCFKSHNDKTRPVALSSELTDDRNLLKLDKYIIS